MGQFFAYATVITVK
ncbi:TPA: membrane protein YoeI [Escherichia coli]|nr:membrane protein YoeI [Escherichia coli]HAN8673459.1 membrane protein YoeI [Escherichia coli]